MHETQRQFAEQHERAAKAAGIWHWKRALEYSDHAYRFAKEAHNKPGQMVTV